MEGLMTAIKWSDAACATGDASLLHLFFSEEPAEIAGAKAICEDCPLRLPCFEGAVRRAEPWGVWGGELFDRGQVIERRRPRGRPRKEDVARASIERDPEAIIARLREVAEAVA